MFEKKKDAKIRTPCWVTINRSINQSINDTQSILRAEGGSNLIFFRHTAGESPERLREIQDAVRKIAEEVNGTAL